MNKEVIKIIIKVLIYALGLIGAYFGVSAMTSCTVQRQFERKNTPCITVCNKTFSHCINIILNNGIKITITQSHKQFSGTTITVAVTNENITVGLTRRTELSKISSRTIRNRRLRSKIPEDINDLAFILSVGDK